MEAGLANALRLLKRTWHAGDDVRSRLVIRGNDRILLPVFAQVGVVCAFEVAGARLATANVAVARAEGAGRAPLAGDDGAWVGASHDLKPFWIAYARAGVGLKLQFVSDAVSFWQIIALVISARACERDRVRAEIVIALKTVLVLGARLAGKACS